MSSTIPRFLSASALAISPSLACRSQSSEGPVTTTSAPVPPATVASAPFERAPRPSLLTGEVLDPSDVEAEERKPAGPCFRGFRTSGQPAIDVARLGMLCGPSSGLEAPRRLDRGQLDEDVGAPTRALSLARGQCFRAVASAADVEDLELELLDDAGSSLAHANLNAPWVVFPTEGPHCAEQAGKYQLRLRTHGGAGQYELAIWLRPTH